MKSAVGSAAAIAAGVAIGLTLPFLFIPYVWLPAFGAAQRVLFPRSTPCH